MSNLKYLRDLANGIDINESYDPIGPTSAAKAEKEQVIRIRYGTKEEQARDGVEPKHGPRVKMRKLHGSDTITVQVPSKPYDKETAIELENEIAKLGTSKKHEKYAMSFLYDNQHIITALWFVQEINAYRSETSNAEVAKVKEIIRTLLDKRREQINSSNLRTKPMTEKELEIAKKGLRAYVYQELHPETAGSGEIYLYPLSFNKAAKRKL